MRCDQAGDERAPVSDDGRRGFLKCAAGIAGVAAATGLGGQAAAAAADRSASGLRENGGLPDKVPFHGRHQAGIVTPQQLFAGFVGFDVMAESREALTGLFQKLTTRCRVLTDGVKPLDEQVAAERPTPDSLTITLGVGASLFDDRFGLSGHKPRHLKAMPAFPDDRLEPARCHGDLSLQICAQHPDAIVHVLRDLARETHGLLRPRWRADAFLNPSRPSGSPRTFIGFKDGIVNPDTGSSREMNRLLWVTPPCGEPDWALGGSYQVLRLIRFHIEKWDKVPVARQEQIFGRRKASGAPLDGKQENDPPRYRDDPHGRKIPLDSHIRLANPRTEKTDRSRFLRRSYNYDQGFDQSGRMDLGLVFCGYQQNPERQFATVQRRLRHEPLAKFITPLGGGYFFILPGVRDADDWFGSGLLQKT
ncbi:MULTISPECIES: iron uptake transporter deferrochelatase/peroxidase subunit [unclassified Streptomyces]|uniref:iron uptake transporter deferrochelatase/peroxidase subunit n=1 Tax=unclassified Streptomyces TaxID=2593676 RepID=UPI0008898201|nr:MULTISPECIES: iron uptake transporter deferrochelatase/peroxidase subunit [unclassified Streptomyces]PBC86788.1 deferrochelatase/peroxidase EfeB [Streptomyces sp. 2321.6]SDQ72390.1 deferrochelatase/peroxidase EfeB [Streptomyces sp. KS_16]SED44618.1 deferrochelatase/peroxidase EfeB [Streptomyces sp. 2112.3]SEE09441.1 deferrochelatase/peroxidase EfeB [Streptomyces sp. 2133.1]SNC73964.1 deferrochelatase/peroxidase EfeB [Streptomyces sp. 2114.4]